MKTVRTSSMVRLDKAIIETARHISTMTGMSITAVIEEACRGYFKAWLQGASASLNTLKENTHAAP